MNKKILKELSTSLTSLIFAVIAITGVLMFFHVFDNYTKKLHEIIGLGFVMVVFLHVFSNWTLMKKYFTKKIFLILLVCVSSFSVFFSLNSQKSPKTNQKMLTKEIINTAFSSPINKTLDLLNISTQNAKEKLQTKNIKLDEFSSINQLAKDNKVSPFDIFDIIVK